jgi:Fe2+ or Zn2+ uptake regulation protein
VKSSDLARALGSETRRRLVTLVSERPVSAVQAYRLYQSRFRNSNKRRETIYRELERLKSFGFLDKRYDESLKAIVYALKMRRASIDLSSLDVSVQ